MAPISCTPSKHELLGAAIVTLVMMASCSSSYAESDWAERRWEARFDACETADSYVFIKSPDDQECAVLCGRIPTPKVIPLANGSICKTNKGEPGTCNRGECFAREVTQVEQGIDKRTVSVRPGRRSGSRRFIDP